MAEQRGPYISEDRDELYFPISDWTFNQARNEAVEWADEFHGNWGRTHYEGKQEIELHDCADWPYLEPGDDAHACPKEQCWVITTYEGTYRSVNHKNPSPA